MEEFGGAIQLPTVLEAKESTKLCYPFSEQNRDNYIYFVRFFLGATELPSDIQYALRFPERPRLYSFYGQGGPSWRTDNVFPVFEVSGPRSPFSWEGGNDPGYVNEMFIAIQHMISTELIRRFTGEDSSSFNFHLNRYPHPAYVKDSSTEVLQYIFAMFMMLSFSYTALNIVRAITVEKELQLKVSIPLNTFAQATYYPKHL